VVHKFCYSHEARLTFVNLYLYVVYDGETEPTLVLFHDGNWFHRSRHLNSQNDWFPMLIQKMPLDDARIGVWCAVSTTRITGHLFPPENINSHTYCTHSNVVFKHMSNYKRTDAFFLQECNSYTANNSRHLTLCFF
jgi:hypothetical protein